MGAVWEASGSSARGAAPVTVETSERMAGTVDEWSERGFGFGTVQDGRPCSVRPVAN